mmetsp:Transcript_35628/g.54794  ORF Transcript_35628/g.54794 Transcript_35628/m.54794 type:complete len:282 (+) Transcript_35628:337-1182(+)
MRQGTIIVTGGSNGIGKAIALSLTKQGKTVVIVSRDEAKGAAAIDEIKHEVPKADITCVVGNVSTVASTHELAETLIEKYPNMTVLINNAGVWQTDKQLNDDGLETSFMVNHLAPFILTQRLMFRLQSNAPARIINLSAGTYIKGNVDLEKTPYGHDFHGAGSYANSKLCNVLFTRQCAKQIEGTGVMIHAVHPGVIRTGLGDTDGMVGFMLTQVKRFWRTPEEGAVAPVWLATSPEIEKTNGLFFNEKEVMEFQDQANDEELGKKLWELSMNLAKFEQYA